MSRLAAILGLSLFVLGFTFGSISEAQACDQRRNPHSWSCHEAAFEGRAGFPLLRMDELQMDWFATTYATPQSNFGSGFQMDLDPRNPRIPGIHGVMNVFNNGARTVVGDFTFNGAQMIFHNWQGAALVSTPGSVLAVDDVTVQWTAVDHFRISHLFQCRNFLRGQSEHLTCKWFVWTADRRGGSFWNPLGYFGFMTRQDWDDFVRRPRR